MRFFQGFLFGLLDRVRLARFLRLYWAENEAYRVKYSFGFCKPGAFLSRVLLPRDSNIETLNLYLIVDFIGCHSEDWLYLVQHVRISDRLDLIGRPLPRLRVKQHFDLLMLDCSLPE